MRPLVLLLDGHLSHYCPEFIRLACEKGVIVFCLPPHLTHLLQPLDASCFHALKIYWDEACDQFMGSHPGRIVTIYQFSQLFATAWRQAMTPSTIVAGFKTTGVFPINRRAVVLPGEVLNSSSTPTAVVAKKRGILYMPFYPASPAESGSVSPNQPSSDQTVDEPDSDHLDSVDQSVDEPDSDSTDQFTSAERECYERRYEEGYDLTQDDRYNQWLRVHYADNVRVQLFKDPNLSTGTLQGQQASPSDVESDATSPPPSVRSKLSSFLPVPTVPQKKTTQKPTGVCDCLYIHC